ncbi:hypothetical protein GEI7407_3340 [Geitlerinema sp. PCC 7407]|nr:hypothetical protein GEI7407_3340 [Geitlerinema sp. PCC 7407]
MARFESAISISCFVPNGERSWGYRDVHSATSSLLDKPLVTEFHLLKTSLFLTTSFNFLIDRWVNVPCKFG